MTRNRMHHKKTVKRRKPEEKEQVKGQSNASEKAMPDLVAMQQQVGNQAIQRVLQSQGRSAHPSLGKLPLETASPAQVVQTAPERRERSSAEVALDARIPGAGSDVWTAVADIANGLDVAVNLFDFAGLAASGKITTALLGAGGVMTATIAFIVASMYGLADAYKAGEKLAAVMGESYGVLYAANGKDPPSAPGDWAAGATFNRAAKDARKRLSDVVKKGGKPANRMLCFLINLRKDSEQGLNDVYQELVEQNLQARFFGFKVGGRLYNEAKSRRLAWPQVRWYYKR